LDASPSGRVFAHVSDDLPSWTTCSRHVLTHCDDLSRKIGTDLAHVSVTCARGQRSCSVFVVFGHSVHAQSVLSVFRCGICCKAMQERNPILSERGIYCLLSMSIGKFRKQRGYASLLLTCGLRCIGPRFSRFPISKLFIVDRISICCLCRTLLSRVFHLQRTAIYRDFQ
jgi:hypothetical protein